jgi:hypothetical protein
LTWVPAGELAALAPPPAAAGGGGWNAAVFALLAALPADTPVVLFWY